MSAKRKVHLATCLDIPEPDTDAPLLAAALVGAGCEPVLAAWDDDAVDWSAADLCVVRSTWNYYHRREEFLAWAARVARVTKLLNPRETIEWNTDKRYLRELEAGGVRVVPTEWIERGTTGSLEELMARRGWDDVVIKPVVSAASFATMRVTGSADRGAGEAHLASFRARRDVMVQPYVKSVDLYGERSLVWIDGVIDHAIRKSPRFHGACLIRSAATQRSRRDRV